MELTQRLECTQDVYSKCSEKEYPDQIGFLGICGTKYPLKKGPNKIGRDPDTCNINLNLNSISRQHAVINILNKHEYMLMDLDSANKTKLCDKTLQPYIPYPMKNGDMVQFGQVFGVFRLFEDENDLPLTQAIDIPETPVHSRHVSKFNTIHATTIPESPDVSDKDDSFIIASQPKKLTNTFKSPINRLLKISGSNASIKPMGTNKIDNAYWSSSKKSDSFSSQCNVSNNDSLESTNHKSNQPNIHEVNTQVTDNHNDTTDSIYNANTQFIENPISPLIHNMETQVPSDLPEVCKIQDQHNLHFNFTTDNKENDNNIFNAETQIEAILNKKSDPNNVDKEDSDNEVILFEEIDIQPLQDNFESQALLPPEFEDLKENKDNPTENTKEAGNNQKCTTKVRRLKSDSSTDCEDEDINIAMTQKICELNDDDVTDCEDEPEVSKKSNDRIDRNVAIDDDVTDCEDNFDEESSIQKKTINELDTQIINEETNTEHTSITGDHYKNATNVIDDKKDYLNKQDTAVCFEDLPTQILEEKVEDVFEEALTQKIYSEEIVTLFKKPKPSPFKLKKKDVSGIKLINQIISDTHRKSNENVNEDDQLYYAATQDILDDLYSQRQSSSINKSPSHKSYGNKNITTNEISVASNVSIIHIGQDSSVDSDIDDKIDSFVSSLTNSQIRDVVGVKNNSSSVSNPKVTPKSVSPVTNLTLNKNRKKKISSDLVIGNDKIAEIKLKDKKAQSLKIKTNITKKLEDEIIPTRVITRIRKPTTKMQNNDDTAKNTGHKTQDVTNPKGREEGKEQTKTEKVINKNEKSNKAKSEKDDKKHKTKEEKKKPDKETRGRKRKEELKLPDKEKKQSTVQSNNKTIVKDIRHYLDNTNGLNHSRSNQKPEAVNEKIAEKKDKPQTREQSTDKNHRTRSKETIEDSESPLKSVRRSRRNRSSKKTEEIQNDITPKAKPSHPSLEQSAVYSTSSDSFNKVAFKRSATENFEFPSAKKTRTETNSNNVSLRANPARKVKTHSVLFTAFPCEEVKIKLEKLGAKIVSDVMQCTVVLTMQIKRTFKLLCALGLGKPIVGPSWVQVCADTNMIVDPWLHLIKDEATERRFQFNLERSLAVRRGFLKGYNISATPSVTPNAQEMQSIVECSGGTWKSKGPNWICVSAINDKALWPALRKKGAIIVSTEFILAGVLRQKVEIDKNKLQ